LSFSRIEMLLSMWVTHRREIGWYSP